MNKEDEKPISTIGINYLNRGKRGTPETFEETYYFARRHGIKVGSLGCPKSLDVLLGNDKILENSDSQLKTPENCSND